MKQMETLKSQVHQGVCVLTISRPEALNALNAQVLTELDHFLADLETKSLEEIKVLVVTGAGEKAFVAGADIKEIHQLDAKSGQLFAERGQRVFRRFENLKIPSIAAVNGFALGGGLELALSCDFIYASENAKFGLPEVTLGLIPGFGGTVRLSRAIGMPRAKEWIFSGAMKTATEALAQGLVNEVLPAVELMPRVLKTAEMISSRGPVAVAAAKKSVMQAYDQTIDEGLKTEAHLFSSLISSSDMKEGTSAFIEKRKAVFQGK